MVFRSRGLVRSLLFVILGGLAACAAPAPPGDPPEDVRRIAAALDFLAADYPRAVRDGVIVDASEHARLATMLKEASRLARALPERGAGAPAGVEALMARLARGDDGREVAAEARALRRRVRALHGLDAAPVEAPDRARVAQLYGMLCAGCHGTRGLGDGPQGLFLHPEPRSFRDPEIMKDISPLRAYNAITDGIPWTAMPSWGTFQASERWGLAFHVFGMRHAPDEVARGRAAWARARLPTPTPTRLAWLSDGELVTMLARAGLDEAARRDALAWLRVDAPFIAVDTPLAAARGALAEGLAAMRRRDRGAAAAAMTRAHLDGLAPIAAARDASLAAHVEAPFLELRRLAAEGAFEEYVERALMEVSLRLDAVEEQLVPPPGWPALLALLAPLPALVAAALALGSRRRAAWGVGLVAPALFGLTAGAAAGALAPGIVRELLVAAAAALAALALVARASPLQLLLPAAVVAGAQVALAARGAPPPAAAAAAALVAAALGVLAARATAMAHGALRLVAAVALAGVAVHAAQLAAALPAHAARAPRVELLGLYPTVEGLAAALGVAIAFLVLGRLTRLRSSAPRAA